MLNELVYYPIWELRSTHLTSKLKINDMNIHHGGNN